jgi:hypothetical protein
MEVEKENEVENDSFDDGRRFGRGLAWGILLSIPLWGIIGLTVRFLYK